MNAYQVKIVSWSADDTEVGERSIGKLLGERYEIRASGSQGEDHMRSGNSPRITHYRNWVVMVRPAVHKPRDEEVQG